mmetsp:Transcript_36516/g.90884  ORF Transcript_36516/g.90884 Transcript_36516/m.90884 type:complete len:288 (-) Transcript_36516:694-1557(-)
MKPRRRAKAAASMSLAAQRSRSSTTAVLPCSSAIAFAVSPSLFFSVRSAPASRRETTMLLWPNRAASCSAESPAKSTLFTGEPLASSILTTWLWPQKAALCSALLPDAVSTDCRSSLSPAASFICSMCSSCPCIASSRNSWLNRSFSRAFGHICFGLASSGQPRQFKRLKAEAKSRKKASWSLAYSSTIGRKTGSSMRAMSVGSIVRDCVSASVNCRFPFHLRSIHLRPTRLRKYSLSKERGCVVHAPSKPERTKWQRPTVCAPLRATMSRSLKPIRWKMARRWLAP